MGDRGGGRGANKEKKVQLCEPKREVKLSISRNRLSIETVDN